MMRTTILRRFVLVVSLAAAMPAMPASALPQFALQSGATCANCHVTPSGGGLRTDGGFNAGKILGLIKPEKTFLSPLYRAESNTLFTEQLSWGFDIRSQIAKRPDPQTGRFNRKIFMMEAAPYLSWHPTEWIALNTAYNFRAPDWPSQQRFLASVIGRPVKELLVEAGFVQPDFGLRYDDHTTFTRSEIRLYPFAQDLGAIVTASPFEWATVSAGIYSSRNRSKEYVLSNGARLIPSDGVMSTGKLDLHYADFDAGISVMGGGSLWMEQGQTVFGMHAGIALVDRASLIGDIVFWNNDDPTAAFKPQGTAYTAMLTYQVADGLSLSARYEAAVRDVAANASTTIRQYVIGAQIFIVPFLELRPEYRWSDSPTLTLAQYTGQIHLYY